MSALSALLNTYRSASVTEREKGTHANCSAHSFAVQSLGEVPEAALKALKFRTLYANLFGGEHLTLGMYAGLLDAVERCNPGLTTSWLDMKIHDSAQPILLLLGEPEGEAGV